MKAKKISSWIQESRQHLMFFEKSPEKYQKTQSEVIFGHM